MVNPRRVFFNHIPKTGGSTINRIAKSQYFDDFHHLTPETDTSTLLTWLKKDYVFITSELDSQPFENRLILMNDKNLTRITLARDPIERLKSYYASTTSNHNSGKIQLYIPIISDLTSQNLSINTLLKFALKRFEMILSNTASSPFIYPIDNVMVSSIYMQWYLASWMSGIDLNNGNVHQFSRAEMHKHANYGRNTPYLSDYIASVIRKFYHVVGTTDQLPSFVSALQNCGIFNNHSPLFVPVENSSSTIKQKVSEMLSVESSLVAEYMALVPEDFIFYAISKEMRAVQ